MPLPENSRITIPRFTPESIGDHYGNNREIDRWAANLPFFKQYTKVLRSVGSAGSVTFSTVTPTWGYFPFTNAVEIVGFKKFEGWTSVNVRASVQFQITNNRSFDLGVQFTGSNSSATSGPLIRKYWLSTMYGASASTHHVLTGEITIDGESYVGSDLLTALPADTYSVQLIGRVQSGAVVTLDQYDNCFLSIIETY